MSSKVHQIRIVGGGQFACPEDERVLIAMERSGVDDIGVGCRGGGCGFCRVRVIEGGYRTGKMSVSRVSVSDQVEGYVLACRLYPLDDLLIDAGKD